MKSSFNYAIVILSFNHPDLTEKTICSVLNFEFDPNQLFLVHNGSEIKNVEFLKNKFKAIQHLVLDGNLGFSGGANAGLATAFKLFDKVLFLTNDTEVISLPFSLPHFFSILSPTIYKRNTDQIDSVMGIIQTNKGKLKHLKTVNEIVNLQKHEFCYAPGTSFALSKDCFEQLNGFDESFHTYWEDVDFSFRALKNNLKVESFPEIKLKHKIGKTCHKNRFYTLYLFQRNRKKFMRKHHFFHFQFFFKFSWDMLILLFRLLKQPRPSLSLNLWWKAIYDQ